MVKQVITTDSFRRAMRVGNLGFRVAGSYIGYQMQNLFLDSETRVQNRKTFHQKNAHRIRKELQSLRGPVMKLGQFLSMQSQSIPDEVIQELTELQMHAPPMHPTLMRTQFKKSLGKNPEEIFSQFDMEPFAAASLGQVHYAVTSSGEEAAVKIQYPAIRRAVQNDFSLLRTVMLPARITKYVTKEMLQEVERGILQETDYLNEAQNIEFFRKNLKQLPFVRVPKVLKEYTKEKVITMSLMRGEFLDLQLKKKSGQKWRDRLGSHLFELFLYQLFSMGAIHADPHPGNYLYDDDGSISLIDFGCVKYLSDRIMDYFNAFSDREWENDKKKLAQIMNQAFGKKIDLSNEKDRHFVDALIEYNDYLLPSKKSNQTVDFGDPELFDRLFDLFDNALKNHIADPDFFFICRAELGLFNVLFKLGAKVNTTEIADRIQQP